jgi:hypothetical protein
MVAGDVSSQLFTSNSALSPESPSLKSRGGKEEEEEEEEVGISGEKPRKDLSP